ncbi:MAG: response regulator [Thermomicrobiales bacterium]|nr:response regulator [Thermomicrobiales bacterium]
MTEMRALDKAAPLRVLIADNDGRVRRALRALLAAEPDIRVVGEAATVAEALAQNNALHPALILLDLLLPTADDGLQLVRMLAGPPVVALSVRGGLHGAAFQAGAAAFVEKGSSAETLLAAIRAAARTAVRNQPDL